MTVVYMIVSPAVEWCAEMTQLIAQAAFLLIPAKVGQVSLCSHAMQIQRALSLLSQ